MGAGGGQGPGRGCRMDMRRDRWGMEGDWVRGEGAGWGKLPMLGDLAPHEAGGDW